VQRLGILRLEYRSMYIVTFIVLPRRKLRQSSKVSLPEFFPSFSLRALPGSAQPGQYEKQKKVAVILIFITSS